jgi:hypothetical protein
MTRHGTLWEAQIGAHRAQKAIQAAQPKPSSWWLDLAPDEFYARQHEEQKRLTGTRSPVLPIRQGETRL